MAYKTRDGAHPSIKINVLRKLPQDRYVAVLKRVREAVANGRPLEACDDTTPGNKSTSCSWGLCHDSAETWPDAQDHTFPVDFEKSGRISALSAPGKCPLDKRDDIGGSGCFWSCRVFQGKRGSRLTREQVLALYDDTIRASSATQPTDGTAS